MDRIAQCAVALTLLNDAMLIERVKQLCQVAQSMGSQMVLVAEVWDELRKQRQNELLDTWESFMEDLAFHNK